jgi:hypothetical protein
MKSEVNKGVYSTYITGAEQYLRMYKRREIWTLDSWTQMKPGHQGRKKNNNMGIVTTRTAGRR